MLIEYTATDEEDDRLERALKRIHIKEWFNPEDGYYILETDDERVPTIMMLFNIDFVISKPIDTPP